LWTDTLDPETIRVVVQLFFNLRPTFPDHPIPSVWATCEEVQ
jgi:hypothetical protein